jgi:hypothetical protein
MSRIPTGSTVLFLSRDGKVTICGQVVGTLAGSTRYVVETLEAWDTAGGAPSFVPAAINAPEARHCTIVRN